MVKKKQPELKQDVFFVGILDPIEIRRTLLESSKEMVQLLQRYERFREVKKEKHENILRLKETIKELQREIQKLKQQLPATHLRIMLHEEKAHFDKEKLKALKKLSKPAAAEKAESKKESLREAKQEQMTAKESNELEKLESELAHIENKLSQLV